MRFAGLALIAALLACSTLIAPHAVTAEPAPVIRIGMTAGDGYAEAYYAQEIGLFKKAGIQADIRPFSSGAAVGTGIASGTIDIGISNVIYLAKAVAHGTPFVFLAGGGMYSTQAPIIVLAAPRISSLRAAKDLEGKTLAITGKGDQNQVAIDAWMSHNGADYTKVRYIELPFAEVHAALTSGMADAGIITEPWLSAALASGNTRVLAKPYDSVGSQFFIGIWFTTAQWYAKNRAVAKRFINVIYQTARWANAHHDRTAPMLARFSKIDAQTIASMRRAPFATTLDPSMIQSQLNLAYRYHIVDRPMSAIDLIAK